MENVKYSVKDEFRGKFRGSARKNPKIAGKLWALLIKQSES